MLGTHVQAGLVVFALLASEAAYLPDDTATSCELHFDGEAFFKAASRRGLAPSFKSEDCDKVSVANNKFYAMPLRACKLVFENASWLTEGARFKSMNGPGRSQSHVDRKGVEFTIKAGGGFYLDSVTITVTNAQDATSCEAEKIEDVLGNG